MLKWRYYYNQIKLTLEILYCAHAGLSHSIRPTIEDLLHSNDSRSKEEDPNHPTSKETTAKEGVSIVFLKFIFEIETIIFMVKIYL
jgi:hypothetical protein